MPSIFEHPQPAHPAIRRAAIAVFRETDCARPPDALGIPRKAMADKPFIYQDPFPLGPDTTEYECISR